MKTVLYGGSFNPPHRGHVAAAKAVRKALQPDRYLIMPDNLPPHKTMADNSPTAQQRLELCRLAFEDVKGAEVSDLELKRQGKSYTSDTVQELKRRFPQDDLILVVGTDMLLSFENWHMADYIMANASIVALARENGDLDSIEQHAQVLREQYHASVTILKTTPFPASSSEVRDGLKKRQCRELVPEKVYAEIIRKRYYSAKPDLDWLRESSFEYLKKKRRAHVAGCAEEAVRLAKRWGADEDDACEAGLLHDITKKLSADEQLMLCEKYGIINDNAELHSPQLLHAKTGAAFAREQYGVPDEIASAIRWHTTAKPDMTLLEKIIYLADYIEPTRDFPGVDTLRREAYEDLDGCLAHGLAMSIENIRSDGSEPYKDSVEAFHWYNHLKGDKYATSC